MDILTELLDRVRLKGTLLFHYELGRPWSLALPRFPDAVFHYLSRGSAILALEDGSMLQIADGDSSSSPGASPISSVRISE